MGLDDELNHIPCEGRDGSGDEPVPVRRVDLDLKGGLSRPGDRKGPLGAGPMTGRGAGFCADFINDDSQQLNRGFRLGRRWRRSFGAGMRRQSLDFQELASEQEAEVLQRRADWLTQMLAAVKQRIEALNQES